MDTFFNLVVLAACLGDCYHVSEVHLYLPCAGLYGTKTAVSITAQLVDERELLIWSLLKV